MKGRPKKPAVIKQLHGTFRADRANPHEARPEPLKTVEPPEWLDDYGRECWNAHVPALMRHRLLTPLGVQFFAMACERWSTYRRAVDELKSSLTHTTEANGHCSRPEVAIAKSAFDDFRKAILEFGMTPGSVGKVQAAPIPDDDDPAAKFFRDHPRQRSARRFLA